MAEFDLSDLEKINSKQEIIDFLVDHDIIKEKKFNIMRIKKIKRKDYISRITILVIKWLK